MKGAFEKISDLEKQLLDFEQKHGDLQGELLLIKRKTYSYQKMFSGKCAALSKAHRKFGGVINDNDVIHVTKSDNNFHKRIFFGKLHYGLSSGKIYVYARISFNKKVTAVTKKMQGKRPKFYKPFYGIWRARGYRNIVSLTYKIIST